MQGCIKLSGIWFYSPPCIWFSSPQHVALRYKIFDFLPQKAIKQYVIDLNSVKLCCSNQISPFGTAKSVKSFKKFFCPRRKVFVGDYEVVVIRSLSFVVWRLAFKTFSYLLNQTSEVHETLPVLFLCQWELVYQFSEKFINFYYPLPIIFVVICYWT